MMTACRVNLDALKAKLVGYIDTEYERLDADGRSAEHAADRRLPPGVQRAVIHVQSSGPRRGHRRQRCWWRSSPSARATPAHFLQQQGMTRSTRLTSSPTASARAAQQPEQAPLAAPLGNEWPLRRLGRRAAHRCARFRPRSDAMSSEELGGKVNNGIDRLESATTSALDDASARAKGEARAFSSKVDRAVGRAKTRVKSTARQAQATVSHAADRASDTYQMLRGDAERLARTVDPMVREQPVCGDGRRRGHRPPGRRAAVQRRRQGDLHQAGPAVGLYAFSNSSALVRKAASWPTRRRPAAPNSAARSVSRVALRSRARGNRPGRPPAGGPGAARRRAGSSRPARSGRPASAPGRSRRRPPARTFGGSSWNR